MTPAHRIVVTGCSPEVAKLAKLPGEARGLPLVATLIKPVKVAKLRGALAGIGKA